MVNADEERKRKNPLYTNLEGGAGSIGKIDNPGRQQALDMNRNSGTRAQQKAQFDARQARNIPRQSQPNLMMPTNKTNVAIAAYNNALVNLSGQQNTLDNTKLRGSNLLKTGQALSESNIERDRLRSEQGLASQQAGAVIAADKANVLNERNISANTLADTRRRSNQSRTQALSAWAGGASPEDAAAVQSAGAGDAPFDELSRNIPLSRTTISKEKAIKGKQDIAAQYNVWKAGPGNKPGSTIQDYLAEAGLLDVYDEFNNALGLSTGDKAVDELLQ